MVGRDRTCSGRCHEFGGYGFGTGPRFSQEVVSPGLSGSGGGCVTFWGSWKYRCRMGHVGDDGCMVVVGWGLGTGKREEGKALSYTSRNYIFWRKDVPRQGNATRNDVLSPTLFSCNSVVDAVLLCLSTVIGR